MRQFRRNPKTFILLTCAIIVLNFIVSCGWGEKCYKDYYFVGTVTDSNFAPLADVQVVLYGKGDALLTTTNLDGTYSWTSFQTRSWYSGRGIKFVKAGYKTFEADLFTVSEAGPNVCGAITLRRDAVLQLQ